jgi:DNA-binding NarL/FixJ family response regulator
VAQAVAKHSLAKRYFEDAIELWSRAGIPHETARARMKLAATLLVLNRKEAASQQAHQALQTLEQLGAMHDQAQALALLRQIESLDYEQFTPRQESIKPSSVFNLTPRELDVLRLIVDGKSNQEIAETLVVSVRTTERHISNLYAKLGVEGKSARALVTAYALRHDLLHT